MGLTQICEEWDGAVYMQESECICTKLLLNSKGDSVSYRETLKFREMVDTEDVSQCMLGQVTVVGSLLRCVVVWGGLSPRSVRQVTVRNRECTQSRASSPRCPKQVKPLSESVSKPPASRSCALIRYLYSTADHTPTELSVVAKAVEGPVVVVVAAMDRLIIRVMRESKNGTLRPEPTNL